MLLKNYKKNKYKYIKIVDKIYIWIKIYFLKKKI